MKQEFDMSRVVVQMRLEECLYSCMSGTVLCLSFELSNFMVQIRLSSPGTGPDQGYSSKSGGPGQVLRYWLMARFSSGQTS